MKKALFVLSFLVLATTAHAAGRVFYDSWETGNTDLWQQDDYRNKCIVVTSALDGGAGPRGGTRMARCNWNGAVAWNDPASVEVLQLNNYSYGTELLVRFWERIDNDVDSVAGSGGKYFRIGTDGAGTSNSFMALHRDSGDQEGSFFGEGGFQIGGTFWGGGSHAANGAWHKVEVYIKQSSTAGIVRLWEDDVLLMDHTGQNTQFAGTGSWHPFVMMSNWSGAEGCCNHDANNHVYWDEFEIYSDTGSGNTTGALADGSMVVVSGPDTTPPTVGTVSPANGATNVALTSTVVANMSEDVDAATVTTTTVELRDNANALVARTVSESSPGVITITPSAPLATSMVYTAKVIGGASGVKDVAGNALASTFTWTFTTIAPDTTPPTVTSTSPTNAATNIATTIAPAITFSEPMNAATLTTSTIDLRAPGNVQVLATVSYNATTRVATITPTSALALNTAHTLTIIGGASGVKDVANNAMVSNVTVNFTTTNSTDDTTLGLTSVGTVTDAGDSNYMNGSKVTTVTGGTVASVSVYVGPIDANTANRSFQVAIYTHNAGTGKPDALVANSTTGTLVANSWNTIPVTATLAPATSYWLVYNTNGLTNPVNNMTYNVGAQNSFYSTTGTPFGTWPTTAPATTLSGATFGIYVTFAPPAAATYTLTVTKAGTGTGTVTATGINCGSDCTESYNLNTIVPLTALAGAGSTFIGWSGDSDCADGSVTMAAARNCIATFQTNAPSTFSLTITKSGSGTGTVTTSPAGIDCGPTCSAPFADGTVVTLSATAAAGSIFTGFGGDADCLDGIVTMSTAVACSPNFTIAPPSLVSLAPVCPRSF